LNPLRKLTKSHGFRKFLGWILAYYIKFVYKTTPWAFEEKEAFGALLTQGKPIIVAFWHGRLAMMPCAWTWDVPVHMLLSKHSDGQIIASVLSHFRIASIFGSTSRGGVGAGVAVLDALKKGHAVGITPDGPRGPTQVCSSGIITLAKIASDHLGPVFIVPCSYSISFHKHLGSWDRFMAPFPFARRGCFQVGSPLIIESSMTESTLKDAQKSLEISLTEVQNKGDEKRG
jgi:hypothetical protein